MTVFLVLLALPLGAALALAAGSYAAFGLAVYRGHNSLFGRACPGQGAACLAQGILSAVVAQLVMILTCPLGPLLAPRRRGSPPVPGQPTVVCLHGLYHTPAAFLAIRPALARAGYAQVAILAYRSLGTDFEAEAQRLLAVLRATLAPDAPLCFLGHSLGGLLARRLAAEPDLARRTRAIVTLGTPHQGSALAILAVGRLGRSLRPGSRLLARLAALPDPPGARCTALYSPVDGLVVPDTGLDPGRPGWQHVVTPPVAHVAMLYHPATIALVVAAVGRSLGPNPDRQGEGAS
ncbi:alpha/beta fold hydrolase [Desulfovibrio aerotolerans]|uniref:Alpha/beta fold hydrolase n=2 Tax=Solidesulfovibrio aerotolerans TaxID=295255 RepID=A0A7C9MV12_9BACT|nr:alpha/beta fold hydrolase [Solidesulfovibrio aerotolerans]